MDGVLECAYLLAHKLVDFGYLRLERLHEVFVDRTFCHIRKTASHLLVCHYVLLLAIHLLFIQGERYLGISHVEGVIGRVEADHRLALNIGDGLAAAGVVVTEEHHVETWHFFCYTQGGILLVFRGDNATILTAVENANHHVGLLRFLDVLHPLSGAGYHVFKLKSAPEILCQPVRNSWCQHAEHGNLHTLSVQDDIRLHVGLAGLGVDDVGT